MVRCNADVYEGRPVSTWNVGETYQQYDTHRTILTWLIVRVWILKSKLRKLSGGLRISDCQYGLIGRVLEIREHVFLIICTSDGNKFDDNVVTIEFLKPGMCRRRSISSDDSFRGDICFNAIFFVISNDFRNFLQLFPSISNNFRVFPIISNYFQWFPVISNYFPTISKVFQWMYNYFHSDHPPPYFCSSIFWICVTFHFFPAQPSFFPNVFLECWALIIKLCIFFIFILALFWLISSIFTSNHTFFNFSLFSQFCLFRSFVCY